MSRILLVAWLFALGTDDHPQDCRGEIVRHIVDPQLHARDRTDFR
ncbi:MAG: hypothetical protein OXU75_13900 [Deltaproteobacteria bacterium]|nr:hypothetical protein [Deltaproteobacteria bacterium]